MVTMFNDILNKWFCYYEVINITPQAYRNRPITCFKSCSFLCSPEAHLLLTMLTKPYFQKFKLFEDYSLSWGIFYLIKFNKFLLEMLSNNARKCTSMYVMPGGSWWMQDDNWTGLISRWWIGQIGNHSSLYHCYTLLESGCEGCPSFSCGSKITISINDSSLSLPIATLIILASAAGAAAAAATITLAAAVIK